MEMFGKIPCVTFDELVGSGIMSRANYKNMFVTGSSAYSEEEETVGRHKLPTKVCRKPSVPLMTQEIHGPKNSSYNHSSP